MVYAPQPDGGVGNATSGTPVNDRAFNPKLFSNPPPDPRLASTNPSYRKLQQGLMQQTDDWVKATGQGKAGDKHAVLPQPYPYRVNFTYNPSTVSVSYGLDPSILNYSQLTKAQRAASVVKTGMTNISFTLLFDRTYECWDGGIHGKLFPKATMKQIGCYADVMAFERMVGAKIVNSKGKPIVNNLTPIPLVVVFGGGLQNPGLAFVGFITSASLVYTHFTSEMVPVRAAMDISMTQLIGDNVEHVIKGVGKNTAKYRNTASGNSTAGTSTGTGTG